MFYVSDSVEGSHKHACNNTKPLTSSRGTGVILDSYKLWMSTAECPNSNSKITQMHINQSPPVKQNHYAHPHSTRSSWFPLNWWEDCVQNLYLQIQMTENWIHVTWDVANQYRTRMEMKRERRCDYDECNRVQYRHATRRCTSRVPTFPNAMSRPNKWILEM